MKDIEARCGSKSKLSQDAYIKRSWNNFGSIKMALGLSLYQCPKTNDEIETMNYASVVGSLT